MRLAGDKHIFSTKNQFRRFKRDSNRWGGITLLLILIVALPVVSIAVGLFSGPGETWGHIVNHLLVIYLSNSLFLLLLCGFLSVLTGVGTAWIVTRYEFFGRRYFEWILILPLAIPTYIMAYTYAGIFDYGGAVQAFYRVFDIPYSRLDIMNKYGLAFVLSISLFPYVYVSSRAFFLTQANNLIEVSKTLGIGETSTFFRLVLPLARPAIVAGLILVLMEVLNDYGAASYYGVGTFTTGIFRAWFSIGEPATAVYISALFMVVVFLLILAERWQRGHKKIASPGTKQNLVRKEISRRWRVLFLLLVLIPVLLGFVFPLLQLLYWAYLTADRVLDTGFWYLSAQSFGIAMLAAFFTLIFSVCLVYFSKWSKSGAIRNLSKVGTLGYAIPGAIIAIGVMSTSLFFDGQLITVVSWLSGDRIGLFFTGSLSVLLYAYCIRFMAVAYNPVESMSHKVGNAIPDSSNILGVGHLRTFFRIELPLIKRGLFGAFMLVFVDVLKELPLTLILKPFGINTLAIKSFEYASDEMIMESALPSLFIIFTAIIPVIVLNKLLIDKN